MTSFPICKSVYEMLFGISVHAYLILPATCLVKKLECADLLEVTCWSPSHLPCYNQVGQLSYQSQKELE
jgi:hypothetical protein